MTSTQIVTLVAITLYFIAMIIVGIIASRKETHQDFIIGNRDVGYIPTIGSLASSFRDGMGIIFWFGFGVAAGYGGLWLFVGAMLGLIVYTYIGPSVRKIAKTNNYVTIGEMLRVRYGVITERTTALIIVFFALMMIAVQLFVAGNVFSAILGISAWVGIALVAAVVAFYLYFGGYGTVIKTDVIQFFLIISLIMTPLFFTPSKEAVMNFSSISSLGFESSMGLALIGFFYMLSGAETWQRVFSARNDNVIRYSFPIAGVFLIIMTLSLIFLGMASAPFMGDAIGADNAFYEIFKGDFVPSALLAFIAVVVMAICMSTLDTQCYLVASTLGKNFMPEHITGTRESYVRFSQIVIVLILAGMSAIALTISDVIVFAINAASLLFVLAPVYLYAAFNYPKTKNRKTDALVSIGVALNTIFYIYMFIGGAFENLLMVSAPAFCSIILTSIAIYMGQKDNSVRISST